MQRDKATINVYCDHIKEGHRIDPFVFGHFVEDIRDHMDAMLAYVLKDMDFEREDDNNDGVCGCWYPVNPGKNTYYALEPAARYHSGHSQRIRINPSDQTASGIGQRITLRGGVEYNVTLYARSSPEIKRIQVRVVDLESREFIASRTVAMESHDWREYSFTLEIPRDVPAAEFQIVYVPDGSRWPELISKGNLWLDHVSMLPEDAVGNVRRDVFEMAKRLNAGVMRFGGNEISGYHWQDYVGPYYERPSKVSEAWGMWVNKYFGTDEFLQFCEALEVEPLICINAGTATPEEAGAWVEYCNGSIDTPMGALRAKHGHPEPYNVKYWEIGNEMWGPWQIGHCSAEEFAERHLAYAKAIKEVYPEAILLACGHRIMDWNIPLLEKCADTIDYLTLHIYHGFSDLGSFDMEPEDAFRGIVAYPEMTRYHLQELGEMLEKNPNLHHIKLAITEYNTMYYPNTRRVGTPREHTLEAAVANAANLNEFLRWAHLVKMAHFSDLVNGWQGGCIRVGDVIADQTHGPKRPWNSNHLTVYGTPTYYALELYANRPIDYVLKHEAAGPSFTVNAPNYVKRIGTNPIPVVDTVACINEGQDTVTLFMVNRGLEDLDVEITLDSFEVQGKPEVSVITGESLYLVNDAASPEKVVTRTYELESLEDLAVLKAHTIYALTVRGKVIR